MTDVARQKFAALMAEIESLEDALDDLQRRCENAPQESVEPIRRQLVDVQRHLAEKKTELQRISDGCGKPRVA